jgi:ribose-phosphate pyrophosphokinase
MQDVRIFGLSGTERYAQRVADYLDMPLSPHTEKYFSDTESYLKSDVNVRGYECYIVHSTYGDDDQSVGEKWWNLLVFIGSLIDASSGEISVICPYWGYSRQDRKTESRAPITTKYVGHLLKSMGVRRAITMDVHNLGAYQNAAPISPPALTVDNLELKNLLADFILGIGDYTIPDPIVDNPEDIVVLSPDSGGIGRCRRFRNTMENKLNKMLGREVKIGLASIDKERITHINGDDKLISATVTGGDDIIGDVDGKRVIILDDLIASGKTIGTSVAAIKRDGGELWAAAATHGVFVGEADEHLKEVPRLIIADTIPPFRLDRDSWKDRLHVIPTAKIFAQAIRRTHEHGSISELIQA